jgi:cytochrome P450
MTGSNHWVKLVLESVIFEGLSYRYKTRPWLRYAIRFFLGGKKLNEWERNFDEYMALSREKARKRIEIMGDTLVRQDFFGHLIERGDISQEYLMGNAQLLLAAGSETTATALAGTTWYLLKNQGCYRRLAEEVRGAFRSVGDITGDSTARCEYLHGVIEEGLRLFPPVAVGLPRVSPGAVIDGRYYVPAGYIVSCENYPLARDPRYWVDPDSFRPERWIGQGLGDDKRAFQPFSR